MSMELQRGGRRRLSPAPAGRANYYRQVSPLVTNSYEECAPQPLSGKHAEVKVDADTRLVKRGTALKIDNNIGDSERRSRDVRVF